MYFRMLSDVIAEQAGYVIDLSKYLLGESRFSIHHSKYLPVIIGIYKCEMRDRVYSRRLCSLRPVSLILQ